ncbi:MAG: 3-phytase [Candidatus Azotimanducaceae bacterium]|jgi:3-phytase
MFFEWVKSFLLVPLLGAYFVVHPSIETSVSPYPGDSIDDIAIWVNKSDPSKSLILTTLKASNQQPVKETGILVYTLNGEQIQFLAGGTPNNIDIRYVDEPIGEVIAVSHWFSGDVTLHSIDHETLQLVTIDHERLISGVPKLAGICLYQAPKSSIIYYIVTGKEGDLALFLVEPGRQSHRLISRFKLESGTEGCAVDDHRQALYVAEEATGVWYFDLKKNTLDSPQLVVKAGIFEPLTEDVEGIALYKSNDSEGYLFISSQGNDEYSVIDRVSHKHIANFSITDTTELGKEIDGTTHTDGIDLVASPLGTEFPNGVFVAQDDNNTGDGERLNQNLKMIPLDKILNQIKQVKND